MSLFNLLCGVVIHEAMKGVLPDETRTRIKKTGWNISQSSQALR